MTSSVPVTYETSDALVRVVANGETVAETSRALVVHETGHAPLLYLPPDDLKRALFRRTTHSSYCPRKGDATYWTITAAGSEIENAAWSYEDPMPQVGWIRGYVSFYTDKVDIRTG